MKTWKLQENVFVKSDLKYISNFILKTKKFTQGPKVKKFEKQFSNWNHSKYSIFVNSGSSADFLIMSSAKELYNWNDGDEIIVPSLTWPTQVSSVIQCGLKPVFIDCNLEDLSIDYSKLESCFSKKTKAIFIAHIMGFPANIKKIRKIIGNRKIKIFEDCCESIGARNPNKIGNIGVAGSFSFYWGHHMTTIEGGMITTNNYNFFKLCKLKRSHGLARELDLKDLNIISKKFKGIDKNFLFLTNGFNLRNTEINAEIGLNQLGKLNNYIKIRNKNFALFKKLIAPLNYKVSTANFKNLNNISSYAFPIFFKKKQILQKFKTKLKENKIEFRPVISGNILKQPFLNIKIKMPNSDFVHNHGIYIGNNQFVTKKMIKRLVEFIRQV